MSHILTPRRPDSLSVEHSIRRADRALEDCPAAIAQWATLSEREDNYFQQIHDSGKAWGERNV